MATIKNGQSTEFLVVASSPGNGSRKNMSASAKNYRIERRPESAKSASAVGSPHRGTASTMENGVAVEIERSKAKPEQLSRSRNSASVRSRASPKLTIMLMSRR